MPRDIDHVSQTRGMLERISQCTGKDINKLNESETTKPAKVIKKTLRKQQTDMYNENLSMYKYFKKNNTKVSNYTNPIYVSETSLRESKENSSSMSKIKVLDEYANRLFEADDEDTGGKGNAGAVMGHLQKAAAKGSKKAAQALKNIEKSHKPISVKLADQEGNKATIQNVFDNGITGYKNDGSMKWYITIELDMADGRKLQKYKNNLSYQQSAGIIKSISNKVKKGKSIGQALQGYKFTDGTRKRDKGTLW